MLTNGRQDLVEKGKYRSIGDPMQVISGHLHNPKIHFEAPPACNVLSQMQNFISWFNATSPKGHSPLPALTRACIAHLYFVSIHPFEDGNGRIARALTEKALSQSLQRSNLIALSYTINKNKKSYYNTLELSNKNCEINNWLAY